MTNTSNQADYPGPERIGNLMAAHPSLFRKSDQIDFAVGEGWKGILTDLCDALEGIDGADLRVIQVKEKFGGLRFYIQWDYLGPDNDQVDAEAHIDRLIRVAEEKAWETCENGGALGEIKRMSTLCSTCRTHLQEEV